MKGKGKQPSVPKANWKEVSLKDHHLPVLVVTVPAAVLAVALITKEASWLLHKVRLDVTLQNELKNSSVKIEGFAGASAL